MARPEGFTYQEQPGAGVLISHHGRPATRLRGETADRFLTEVRTGDAQLVMARWTGNYKRGNERTARDHPRNRGGRGR